MAAPPTLMQVLVLVTMVLLTGTISRQRQAEIIAIVESVLAGVGMLIVCGLVAIAGIGVCLGLFWVLVRLVGVLA